MKIEERLFGRSRFVKERLIEYGFRETDSTFLWSSPLRDDLVITVSVIDNSVSVSLVDSAFDEEYLGFRYRNQGAYASGVSSDVERVLLDIRDYCCVNVNYVSEQANRLDGYMEAVYGKVDHPFKDDDETGVYRESGSDKWYALLMRIPYRKLDGGDDDAMVDVINLKADPKKLKQLTERDGIFEAYHMNKKNWISVVLDDTLRDEEIILLINDSYDLVQKKNDEKKYYRRTYR